ncbi:MAG: 23S rRNA (adenine(2503)-C(2))-methyltransferase RlmN [Lentisphaeria bacterium]|nr:23S rRNA (adenine(2503)-C(2))-methyltransferase RlmN [Lentisphaeria bacterium]
MEREALRGGGMQRLTTWLAERGEPGFRASQIRAWLYDKWSISFAAMRNLPKTLRTALEEHFDAFTLTAADRLEAADGTVKWLFRLRDDETIETVLLRARTRTTVCISTQVGCPVRCTFCASGRDGWVRDLTAAEIVDQVVAACHHLEQRVTNVVVMGMGEPLLNLKPVVAALDEVCDPRGLAIGGRHVTLSTSGIVPGIRHLATLRRQWRLALSLHAVSDEKRSRLIPPQYRYPLADILDACRTFRNATGRMVTFEYTLMAGVNDGDDDARALAEMARTLDAKVNLIPCNEVTEHYRPPNPARILHFERVLTAGGAKVTVRRRRGGPIRAACGQLRRR